MKEKAIEYIELDLLDFDPLNPRVPNKIKNSSTNEVIRWMLKDASLIDLMESISTNGFFPGEPLLAIRKNNRFVIIEGNRRLAACKILSNPVGIDFMKATIGQVLERSSKENIPHKLPVVIFDNREEVLSYLGYRHVTGVKSWSSLAKARYLHQLYKIDGEPNDYEYFRLLARKIGSKADYVRKLVISYELYLIIEKEAFFKIENLDDNNFEFSKLADSSTRYSKITSFLGIDLKQENPLEDLDINNLKQLTKWLFEKNLENQTRVGDNRNIRILNEIVGNERALKAFCDGKSLVEARQLTSYPNQIMKNSISESLNKLKTAWNILPEVSETDMSDLDAIRELLEYLKLLNSSIKDKINKKDSDDFQL
ncbi:ParB/RepB/Spo0J family partition protein [Persicobacter psychrovividus]|uniref:ParB/Sulfiredoxin domain-containing protein n=1 Tax=Persicobacter psychrovividus TaxID=387638 RepID=A0ABN6LEE2_9BACT|nr:hypothetical protein PEPS_36970 [Persicobacter psychrovividus]